MTKRQFIETIWLVRVPILSLAALAGFGYAAAGPAKAMLGGLFDVDGGPLGMFLVDLMAFLVACACVTSINVVLHLGASRFGIPALKQPKPRLQLILFLIALPFPVALIYFVCRLTPSAGVPQDIALAVLAFVTAMILVLTAKTAQMYLTEKEVTLPPPPFLVFPASYIPALDAYLNGVYQTSPAGIWVFIKSVLQGRKGLLFSILSLSGEGYFIPQADGLVLESAQVFTAALTMIALGVYLLLGAGHGAVPGPALAYVLLFHIIVTFALAGICFFLDRFRVSVLLTAFLLMQFGSHAPQSDHFFRTTSLPANHVFPNPADVMRRHQNAPILIATAGGGIQAAAWTTTVLDGLSQRCPECGFQSHIAAISGVSGGSVGAMNVGSAWPDLQKAKALSRDSSLDAIAWAWVNPDVWGALLPIYHDKFLDRGSALEESWESNAARLKAANLSPNSSAATLATWSADSSLPAFLFNSTNVESGAPVVFATTTFPSTNTTIVDPTRTARSFHDLFKDFGLSQPSDVNVTTAVRLSATFPYVSPASRPYVGTMRRGTYHFVDGGYYDNYGVYTLLEWLEDAFGHMDPKPKSLAILRILGFPKDGPAKGTVQGWGYQSGAPLDAFLSTRGTGQLVESDAVLSRFKAHWKSLDVDILIYTFRYQAETNDDCAKPALSWKLTAAQQGCLDKAWTTGSTAEADQLIKYVKEY